MQEFLRPKVDERDGIPELSGAGGKKRPLTNQTPKPHRKI
jgi:hypothetical protein